MLKPIVKYPGGKERELKYILPNLPPKIKSYYEPFVGGGAVYFAIGEDAEKALINDKSTDLIFLYTAVRNQDADFFELVSQMGKNWDDFTAYAKQFSDKLWLSFNNEQKLRIQLEEANFSSEASDFLNQDLIIKYLRECVNRKINYLYKQQAIGVRIEERGFHEIMETAFKSAIYMYYRIAYNSQDSVSSGKRAALHLFLRQYAYSSMFRFSKTGAFNVPYGGKSYNKINLKDKLTYYQDPELLDLLNKTVIQNVDFEEFLEDNQPEEDDFLFIDPPYDSDFSKYDNSSFDAAEQKRLANYLINEVKANWMVVIKNTELIQSIYPSGQATANGKQIYINDFKKSYAVNFKNRNSRNVRHLIITNYEI